MEKNELFIYEVDEEVILVPPYWRVEYVDDYGHRHLATIKDEVYLNYLKDRFTIINIKNIKG